MLKAEEKETLGYRGTTKTYGKDQYSKVLFSLTAYQANGEQEGLHHIVSITAELGFFFFSDLQN
jgi:hypothetical protein